MSDSSVGIQQKPAGLVVEKSTERSATHSAPLCAAPWLVAVLAISLVGILTEEISLVPLLSAFAVALVVSGPIGFAASCFTAQKMADAHRERIFPALIGALLLAAFGALGIGFGLLFIPHSGTDWLARVVGIVLEVYLAMNFVLVSFLAVFRKIRLLAIVTFVGFGISFTGASFGAEILMEAGMLVGFVIGQVVYFMGLIRLALREFGRGSGPYATWEIFSMLRKNRYLAWCGFFLMAGVFADKFIPFPVAADWKIATVALLSIVPGAIWFFLHLRTDLIPALQTFANTMGGGESLGTVRHAKDELLHAFRSGFSQVLMVQGIITAALIFWADAVSIPFPFFVAGKDTMLFRVALVGALLFVVFLNLLAILLNLNAIRAAFYATMSFGVLNVVLSLTSHLFFPEWQGFGFVIAAGAALLISVFAVNRRLGHLEFWEWRAA